MKMINLSNFERSIIILLLPFSKRSTINLAFFGIEYSFSVSHFVNITFLYGCIDRRSRYYNKMYFIKLLLNVAIKIHYKLYYIVLLIL